MERQTNDSAYGSIDHSQKSATSFRKSQKSSRSSSYEDTQPSVGGGSSDALPKRTDQARKQNCSDGQNLGTQHRDQISNGKSDNFQSLTECARRQRGRPYSCRPTDQLTGTLNIRKKRMKSVHDSGDPLLDKSQMRLQLNHKEKSFAAAIAMHDGLVLRIGGAVTSILGYEKDSLIGQCFSDFIYPDDRVTFKSHVTNDSNTYSTKNLYSPAGTCEESDQTSLFCRLRVNQAEDGFAKTEKDNYKTFHIEMHLTDLSKKVHSDDIADAFSPDADCLLIIATPLDSAYRVPEEIPTMHPFTTCHSAACYFCHVDSSAIPYTGYVPQDILGSSVFDFYHPEDLPHLQEVYQQVLKEEGRLFRSKPYRFRVRNGHYVLLETEWSCFINPWTRQLEFVIGRHRVLRGPKEPNVFSEAQADVHIIAEEVLKESINIQTEIKQSLTETVKGNLKDLSEANRRHRKELARKIQNLIEEMVQTMEVDGYGQVCKESESFSDHDSVVMGHISPHHQGSDSDPSFETPLSYHHCNYNDNMQRYFDSRPKTHSTDESMESTGKEGIQPIPRDDSPHVDSGSGDGSGPESVANHSGSEGERNAAPPNTDVSSGSSYAGVALTKEVLQQHNKITEKSFIQKKREDRGSANHRQRIPNDLVERLTTTIADSKGTSRCQHANQSTIAPNQQSEVHGIKRGGGSHSTNPDSRQSHKHLREDIRTTDKGERPMIVDSVTSNWPPFSGTVGKSGGSYNALYTSAPIECNVRPSNALPLPSLGNLDISEKSPLRSTNYYCDAGPRVSETPLAIASMPTHVFVPSTVQYVGAIPGVVYPISRLLQLGASSVSVSLANSISCQQSSVGHPVKKEQEQEASLGSIAGRCGIAQSFDCSPAAMETRNSKPKILNDHPGSDSEAMDSDLLDGLTGSSLNSFLKSDGSLKTDSQNCSRSSSEKDDDAMSWERHGNKKRGSQTPILNIKKNPYWQERVNMSPERLFNYQMKSRSVADTLEEDMTALKKMEQPSLVSEQLAQLYSEIAEARKKSRRADETAPDHSEFCRHLNLEYSDKESEDEEAFLLAEDCTLD